MLTVTQIEQAQARIQDIVRCTQLICAPKLIPGSEIYLKTENLQLTGSFKVRGAFNKILQLTSQERARGVIACSAGNHAQGVALAAQQNGIKAVICLPSSAPISKIEATKSYGAQICLVEGGYDDAYRRALELRDLHGYTLLHPFDDDAVIAGQGTIGLELYRQNPEIDAVVVPIGGGGLISGIALALKHLNPQIQIYGVQSAGAPSMQHALQIGRVENLSRAVTLADGIAVKQPGERTFTLCKRYVDEIVTVTDDEICMAILALMEQHKLITEGAGAVSVAAVMSGKLPVSGRRIACILSGGNIDVQILSRVVARGLLIGGRICSLYIELVDKPYQLADISRIIGQQGGNIFSVRNEFSEAGTDIHNAVVCIQLETRDAHHITQIKTALSANGFSVL